MFLNILRPTSFLNQLIICSHSQTVPQAKISERCANKDIAVTFRNDCSIPSNEEHIPIQVEFLQVLEKHQPNHYLY